MNFLRAAAIDDEGSTTWSPWLKVQFPDYTMVIPAGSAWRFLDDGSNQGTAWKEPDFDDGLWNSGRAPFGFGGTQATELRAEAGGARVVTYYFRHEFEVTEPYEQVLQFGFQVDDGAALYLNGYRILRVNLPEDPVTSSTLTSVPNPLSDPEAFSKTNLFAYLYDIVDDGLLLRPGRNVLAVELHQSELPDDTARFDLTLRTFTLDDRCCPGFLLVDMKVVNGKLVLTFTGTLASSESVVGPYELMPSAISPFTVEPKEKSRFYRAE